MRLSGYVVSIVSSLLVALIVGLFFIGLSGWSPPNGWETTADFTVTWLLLTYIWIQMGSLILAGTGTRGEMWVDALTSIVPLFVIIYVIIQHYAGYVVLSPFQVRAAWVTAYTMLLDVIVDSGMSVMLSRQVIDIGKRGVF